MAGGGVSWGRLVSTVASCTVVAGCAALVIGMSQTTDHPRTAAASVPAGPVETPRPAFLPARSLTESSRPAPTASSAASSVRASTVPTRQVVAPAPVVSPGARTAPRAAVVAPVAVPRATSTPVVVRRPAASPRTTARATPRPAPRPVAAVGSALPLRYSTGTATRVITVTSSSASRTTATLQAWTKVGTNRWVRYGSAVTAHVGADGIGTASETRSTTPAGSFTLTQAFGRYANPGTRLPYTHTTAADWWISQAGPLYNTHQRCSSGCRFNTSSNPAANPNEHLYYEAPFYNYAVVIDYNTRNAPGGVRAGRGSAFFLHVTDGNPTAGCVAIPKDRLTTIMRWLTPSAHPRILIGVT